VLRRARSTDKVRDILRGHGLDAHGGTDGGRAVARWLLLTSAAPADPEREKRDAIAKTERDLFGCKIPGFFPTPPDVARQMVEAADIQPGQRILEPSAGSGAIADAVREAGADQYLVCIEVNHRLVQLLDLKGYRAMQDDFMVFGRSVSACDLLYDRIVMNPPFEDGQDIEHVMHAYELLKPGGRLVALMSPGGWFRSDRKAVAFQRWLNEEVSSGCFEAAGPDDEPISKNCRARVWTLPEGSFKASGTGVNVRMLVIDKPAAAAGDGELVDNSYVMEEDDPAQQRGIIMQADGYHHNGVDYEPVPSPPSAMTHTTAGRLMMEGKYPSAKEPDFGGLELLFEEEGVL
jgi:precorrin-6B methylase 2